MRLGLGLGLGFATSNALISGYNPMAQDYFDRVVANGDSSLTSGQKSIINAKFEALIAAGITPSHVDRLFADKYCYTEIQALTPWIWNGVGTGLATAIGSPTFTAGVGWTHNGTSYINPNYIASTDSTNFQLANAGWYHSIDSINNGGVENCCGGCNDGASPRFELRALDRVIGLLYWSVNSQNYSYFSSANPYSNYQLKYDGATFSLKADGTTNSDALIVSDHLPSISMMRAAFNNVGSIMLQIQSGAEDRWLCIGDSTLDKDIIEAALAT